MFDILTLSQYSVHDSTSTWNQRECWDQVFPNASLLLCWVSQHVCVDLDQQPNKTGMVFFGELHFASISIYSSKDSHRPIKVFIQKSGVLVILGHGKLTDSLKIKHSLLLFQVPSKGSNCNCRCQFYRFLSQGPKSEKGLYVTINIVTHSAIVWLLDVIKVKLSIPCRAKAESQAPSFRTPKRESTGGSPPEGVHSLRKVH